PKIDGGHQPTFCRRTARTAAKAARAAIARVSTQSATAVGTVVSGIAATSPPVAVRNVVCTPASVNRVKPNRDSRVKAIMKPGARHLIGGTISVLGAVAAAFVDWLMPLRPHWRRGPIGGAGTVPERGDGSPPGPAGERRGAAR